MLTGSALIWTYVAAGFCLFLEANLIYAVWLGRNQVAAGKSWARTAGEIIASDVDAAGSHTVDDESDCTPQVRYRYAVVGNTYESDRIRFGGEPDTTRMMAEQIVGKYPVGSKVDVLYDPRRPKSAVLEAKSGTIPAVYAVLVVCTAVTVVLVAHSIAGKVLYTENGVPLFAFLVPLVAIFLGLACVGACFKIRQQEKLSAHWPTVNGRITLSHVAEEVHDDPDSKSSQQIVKYRPAIQFAYRVGSREYSSSTRKWGWTEIYSDRDGPEAIVAEYPKGANVPVYYDPTNPESAVIEPQNRASTAAPLLGAGMFGGLGVFFLWMLVSLS